MYEILSATCNLKYIATNRKRYHLRILISQHSSHAHMCNAVLLNSFRCNNESAVYKCFLIVYATNLITLSKLVSLIDESMIRCYNKVIRISICRYTVYQINNFCDGFFASNENFIFCIGLISSCINLIVINIDCLLSGKDVTKFVLLQSFNIIKLHTDTIR